MQQEELNIKFGASIEELKAKLAEATKALAAIGQAGQDAGKTAGAGLQQAAEQAGDAAAGIAAPLQEVAPAVAAVAAAAQDAAPSLDALGAAGAGIADEFVGPLRPAGQALADLGDAASGAAPAVTALGDAGQGVGDAFVGPLRPAQAALAAVGDTATQAAARVQGAMGQAQAGIEGNVGAASGVLARLQQVLRNTGNVLAGFAQGAGAELREQLNTRLGATIDTFRTRMQGAVQSIRSVGQSITQDMGSAAANALGQIDARLGAVASTVLDKWAQLPGPIKAVGAALLGLGLVVAAGFGVKKMADAFSETVESARDAARALGTTTQEASLLRETLGDVGSSVEEFARLQKALGVRLTTNEAEMQRWGLSTRDAAGNLRPLNELTLDAIKLIGEYKEGTDRQVAAQSIVGEGLQTNSRLMLLNREALEGNRQAASELGVEVGQNMVAAWADYDAAADRASMTMTGFGLAIQNAVMPVATELTEWFNAIAPAAITVLRGALGGLATAFVVVTNGVRVLWETINALVVTVAEPIRAVAAAIGKAVTGDFAGAAGEVKGIGGTIAGAWGQAMEKIAASSQKTRDRVGRIWAWTEGPDTEPGDTGVGAGTRKAVPRKEKPEKGGAEKADKLELARAALAKAQAEAELAVEAEALRAGLRQYEEAYAQGLIDLRGYYAARQAIEQRAIDSLRAAKQAELDAVNASAGRAADDTERTKLLAQAAKLQGELNALAVREAEAVRAVVAERERAEQALADRIAAIRQASAQRGAEVEIEAARQAIEARREDGQINAEDAVAARQALEDRSLAVTLQGIAARRAAVRGNEAERKEQQAALNAEEEQAARDHQQRLTAIERAAEQERTAAQRDARRGIAGGFQQMVAGVLSGTQRISDALRGFAVNVAQQFEGLIAKKLTDRLFDATGVSKMLDRMLDAVAGFIDQFVTQWITGETTKTAVTAASEATRTGATVAGASTRTAVEVSASATSKSLTIGDAIASIGAKAWQAAANVYAAISAIPIVGPVLAPVAAVAAGATVLGFVSRIASSEGGEYRVDQDRINLVHKDETILPANFATGLRRMIGDGGASPLEAALQGLASAVGSSDPAMNATMTESEQRERSRPMLEGLAQLRGGAAMPQAPGGALSAMPQAPAITWALPAPSMPAAAWRPDNTSAAGAMPMQGGAGDTYHIEVKAMDQAGVQQFVQKNVRAFAGALQRHARDFGSGTK